MRVGFTGSRLGMTECQRLALTALFISLLRNVASEFHHGDCVGSDAEAHAIARTFKDLAIVVHPPTDSRLRANCQGDRVLAPLEYLARNRAIVNSVDAMIATPAEEHEIMRSGTWSTIRYARAKRVSCHVIKPDGRVV